MRDFTMKKTAIICAAVLLLTMLCGCVSQTPKADIAATTLPVYQFTAMLCEGTDLTVTRLVTESVSCLHDYTLTVDQMKAIEANVFNYFGVNEAVLQNKATDEELDSFFNGALEPFSIQLSQVLEKMFFTNREIAVGNRVYVSSNRLQYMSVTHKISLAQQLGDRGMITINEIRELFNYPPLPEGDRAPIRGEYYFAGEEKDNGNDGQN